MTPDPTEKNAAKPHSDKGKSDLLGRGLFVVATPIGNMGDITLRALNVLKACDGLLCEDTRVTGKLFSLLGIAKKSMTLYNDHTTSTQRDRILSRLENGESLALVSDAGSPLISDPGYKLVCACREHGYPVTVIPGPCALIAALQLSGQPTDRFSFGGFLPPRTTARKKALEDWKAVPGTLVFYETGPRLRACLEDIAAILGNRKASIVREITKLHEETRTDSLESLLKTLEDSTPPKGEIVLVIGPEDKTSPAATENTETLESALREAMRTLSMRDAVSAVAGASGRPRKEIYELALSLNRS